MINKLLTEHHFEFLILKGGFTGSSESTLVKMPHCSHVAAYLRVSDHWLNLSHISGSIQFRQGDPDSIL